MTYIPPEQEIRNALAKAPNYIREYVTSKELTELFENLRLKHQLHFDEAGKITDALVATFLEMQPIEKFPNLLREALEQNSGQYDSVLKEVNDKIFTSFRKKLEKPVERPETPKSASQETQPVIEPSSTSSGPVVQSDAPQLLEKKTNKGAEHVSVDTLGSPKTPSPKEGDVQYKSGVDPYRESIE